MKGTDDDLHKHEATDLADISNGSINEDNYVRDGFTFRDPSPAEWCQTPASRNIHCSVFDDNAATQAKGTAEKPYTAGDGNCSSGQAPRLARDSRGVQG